MPSVDVRPDPWYSRLPMTSGIVRPGEETVVSACPTYVMLPEAIYVDDPRSWVLRHAYLRRHGGGGLVDLALTRSADSVGLASTKPPLAWFAPGAWIPSPVDVCLLVSYVGPDANGSRFCGAVTFYLDYRDPYTRRIFLGEPIGGERARPAP
jgi:hypothetical protein